MELYWQIFGEKADYNTANFSSFHKSITLVFLNVTFDIDYSIQHQLKETHFNTVV